MKYTDHFAWYFNFEQIKTSSQEKKMGAGPGRAKRHFKSQADNYEIYVCLSGFMHVSVYVFVFG